MFVVFCFLILFIALPVFAQVNTGIEFGTATGLSTQDIRVTVAKIIRAIIGLLGIIAVVVVLYGGFLWMTSSGSEEKIAKAKKILVNGAIGLAIVLLSFTIVAFIIARLNDALFGREGNVRSAGFQDDVFLSGALGAGPIESHFPPRGAGDIPRNTRIFVTFRESIDPASFISNTYESAGNPDSLGTIPPSAEANQAAYDSYRDLALPEAIQVMRVGANVDSTRLTPAMREQDPEAFAAEAAKLTPVGVAVAADGRTIALMPVTVGEDGRPTLNGQSGFVERQFLGNAQQPTAYVVRLSGAMKKASRNALGEPDDLFTGAFRDGYTWDFTVSTTIDLTPPKITSVIPFPDAGKDTGDDPSGIVGGKDQPRNVIVQVNFNEAMDPTVTTGTFDAALDPPLQFRHLGVAEGEGMLEGTFAISNQYRTVEFTTNEACGENSCGGTVYCLPGDAALIAWTNAAPLEAGGPAGLPFSGVMDAAGNSLDGDADGAAEGPGLPRYDRGATDAENVAAGASDSVGWNFFTTNKIDLTAPEILSVTHELKDAGRTTYRSGLDGQRLEDIGNVSLIAPLEAVFSKLMSGNVTSGLLLSEAAGCNPTTAAGCLWFSAAANHEDTDRDADDAIDATRVVMSHATFRDVEAGLDVPQYRVRVDSRVTDVYQNCFFSVSRPAADPAAPPIPLPAAERGPQGPIGGHRCLGEPGGETCTPPLP